MQTTEDFWGEPIHTYTRAQAFEDGVLIDVTQVAREVGFRWPVAITARVLALIEDIPTKKRDVEDFAGRLWDVLWMAKQAAVRGGQEIYFDLILHHTVEQKYSRFNTKTGTLTWHTRQAIGRQVTLKMVSGPGDNMEPVLTIMLPNED